MGCKALSGAISDTVAGAVRFQRTPKGLEKKSMTSSDGLCPLTIKPNSGVWVTMARARPIAMVF
jgi:hypothetical protein